MKDHKYISKEKRPNYTYYEYPSKGDKKPKIAKESNIIDPNHKGVTLGKDILNDIEFGAMRGLLGIDRMFSDIKAANANDMFKLDHSTQKKLDNIYSMKMKDLEDYYFKEKRETLKAPQKTKKNYYAEMRTQGPK